MKLTKILNIVALSLFIIFNCGCQSKTEKQNENTELQTIKENNEIEKVNVTNEETSSEPVTCVDWIGFYGEESRKLEKVIDKNLVKVKIEGFDKYNSADKLIGNYILKNKNVPIEKVELLAKYLAYNLCLSDNKKFNGVLMNCEKRKIQVAIARNSEKYSNESWAVVYNIFPANKKGELNTMDY